MSTSHQTLSDTANRELVHTRLLNAPRALVFKVWTEPDHIAQWWGPNGFTNTIHEMEVRPGGVMRFIMHGPDGTNWPNRIVFHEVVKNERLTYTHDSDGNENDPHVFEVVVRFEDEGNKTRLTMHTVFPTEEALAEVKKFGAIEGGNQTFNRLEAYLAKMQ